MIYSILDFYRRAHQNKNGKRIFMEIAYAPDQQKRLLFIIHLFARYMTV